MIPEEGEQVKADSFSTQPFLAWGHRKPEGTAVVGLSCKSVRICQSSSLRGWERLEWGRFGELRGSPWAAFQNTFMCQAQDSPLISCHQRSSFQKSVWIRISSGGYFKMHLFTLHSKILSYWLGASQNLYFIIIIIKSLTCFWFRWSMEFTLRNTLLGARLIQGLGFWKKEDPIDEKPDTHEPSTAPLQYSGLWISQASLSFRNLFLMTTFVSSHSCILGPLTHQLWYFLNRN